MNKHYEVLGVVPTASPDEIKRAFRKLALKCHPDRNGCHTAAARFREVYQAYTILIDPTTRAEYDSENSVRPPTPGPVQRAETSDENLFEFIRNYATAAKETEERLRAEIRGMVADAI